MVSLTKILQEKCKNCVKCARKLQEMGLNHFSMQEICKNLSFLQEKCKTFARHMQEYFQGNIFLQEKCKSTLREHLSKKKMQEVCKIFARQLGLGLSLILTSSFKKFARLTKMIKFRLRETLLLVCNLGYLIARFLQENEPISLLLVPPSGQLARDN